jgi:serine/threonine protein kinase/Tfp pilus assembly protein PilF
MTLEVGDPGDGLTSGSGSPVAQQRGVCEACGTPLATDRSGQYCPVCMLRRALGDASGSNLDIPGTTVELESAQYGFEHYKLVLNEDGTPLELGRGAMGVTFKATDINLKRSVALKVVNARYLGNESARDRFVSEARAAAGLDHPNVASVFHLGKTGDDYFYAMEFVEGETLDRVLKFRGPLEVDVALEIVNQVAAALSAAYRHNLVHRDIKPGNLMVVFGEANRVTVKVIDFGLAKPLHYRTSERARSEAGIFLGTPHFSSPEQCLGKETDNRSDIYSLGVTLWVMLTGHVPFEGMVTEVMQKHVHEPPPVERLEHVPKPVVSLIEALLEKDPEKRPQTPYQLQAMIREARTALGAHHEIELVRYENGRLGRVHHRWRNWSLVITVGAVVGIAMACLYLVNHRSSHPIDPKSVAVLPFGSVGDKEDKDEYLNDGLTTEVIFQLSKIADMRVISRSSILRFKVVPNARPKPLNEIGEDLEVATILEGNVQRVENHLRVTITLYDARTSRRLWGEAYDREIKDLLAIQSDIAENIAAALQVRLSPAERVDLQSNPTDNLTADLYLRGMAFYELRHREDNETAITLFKQAIEQDPKFALGYASLANAYIDRVSNYEGDMIWLGTAIRLCRQAIDIDPRQVRGYSGLARALHYQGLDKDAFDYTAKALELAPNDVEAIKRVIYQAAEAGQFEEEYRLLRRCHVLEPKDPGDPYNLGQICAAVGEIDLAQKWMQRALDLERDPERHRMMECERQIFQGKLGQALDGLEPLPLNLISYQHTVLELLVACSLRVAETEGESERERKRKTVASLANHRLEGDPGNWHEKEMALSYLALTAESADDETKFAEQILDSVQDRLGNAEPKYWDHFYLAFATRVLGRTQDAYLHLRTIFPVILRDLPLMNRDPRIDVFASDAEFQALMKAADQNNKKIGKRIRELEKEPA